MEKLLGVEDTAKVLGISVHTVYAWVSSRRIPCVKLGTRTLFQPAALERWLHERSRLENNARRRRRRRTVLRRLG